MKKYLPSAFNFLLTVCILLSAIVISIEFWSYNDAFFKKQLESYNAAQTIGTDMPSLMKVTDKLQDYLHASAENLDIEITRNGENVQFFNEREKDHMVDVLALFNFARVIKYVSLIILASYIILCIVLKLRPFGMRFYKMYFKTVSIVVAVGAALTLIISINFDAAWTFAHTLVFSNDLWLLDPRTDMLINLVPLEFFMAITSRIGLSIAAILGVIYAFCAYKLIKAKKQGLRAEVSENELSKRA